MIQVTRRKKNGKREADLKDLPVEVIANTLPEEKLQEIFGCASRDNQTIVKADRLKELLRNSILTRALAASIMNAKYVNGLPLFRISQEFLRNDIHISRQVMANWMIQCADQYLGPLYDYLHNRMYRFHVLQADENRSRYRRMGVRQTVRVTCGFTGLERAMGIPPSSCMNTRRPKKRPIRGNS